MVYGCAYPSCPGGGGGGGGYFLHLMGYGKGFGTGGSMNDVTQRRILTPFTPPVKLLELSDTWYYEPTWKNTQWTGGRHASSPRYVTRRSAARKAAHPERAAARKTPGVNSPRTRSGGGKQPLHSPQLRKATGRDSPRVPPAGVDSPRLSGRVQKPTRRPKKTVHWKTNIATWIQMNAKNSSMSVSGASNCGSEWDGGDDERCSQRGNDTSDDDGTMRFNTAGKSVCDTATAKEEDSSDFEFTDFSQMSDDAEGKRVYFGAFHTTGSHSGTLEALGLPPCSTVRKPLPPLPVPNVPPERNESHYYSDLNCSCCSSTHTYEDVDDGEEPTSIVHVERQRHESGGSESSSHTYCEIEQVNRGSKPEVLHSLLRNDRRLEVLKSTLVHLLPKDDIISTTLLACRLGDLEYLQDLAKQARLDAGSRDLQGASCVHYAARGGHDHILRFLVEDAGQRGVIRCEVGATPLHDAAALGHLSSLQYLHKHSKHGLYLTDKDGATVLHVAAR